MRPPWAISYAGDLLDDAHDAEEQFAILRWTGCLSAQALADPPAVVALLESTTHEHAKAREAFRQILMVPPGMEGPDLGLAIRDSLHPVGYLDEQGWSQLVFNTTGSTSYGSQILAEVRAAAGRAADSKGGQSLPELIPAPPAPSNTACSSCSRPMRQNAVYCGYCGLKLSGTPGPRHDHPSPVPESNERASLRNDALLEAATVTVNRAEIFKVDCRRCTLEEEIGRCMNAMMAPPQQAFDELAALQHVRACPRDDRTLLA